MTDAEIRLLEGDGLAAEFAAAVGVKVVYCEANNSADNGAGCFIDDGRARPMVRWQPHLDWKQAGPHLVDLGVVCRDMKDGRHESWFAALQVDAYPHRLFDARGASQLEAALRVVLLAVQDV